MKFEQDEVAFLGGVRHGRTMGSPVAIRIGNTEWPKWEQVMSADPVDPEMLDGLARNAPLTRPRPGPRRPGRHAEVRLRRGPAGARARQRPRDRRPRRARRGRARRSSRQALGVELVSHVVELGTVDAPRRQRAPAPTTSSALDADPVRCLDPDASAAMVAEIDAAHKDGDTLGGVVEVVAYGLPPGLGSHVHWDRRLDSRLAGALMGIQAIKGVEVGDGFELARTPRLGARTTRSSADADGIRRTSGRSGGTEGGMTTGEVLRVRAAMKPIATVPRALRTVDVATGEAARRAPPALRRLRRTRRRRRRRGDGRAGARRRGRWRSSAATRSPRPAATSQAYLADLRIR